MKEKKNNWIWMPHPAHFICARDCKFFLATKVGKYIVSTVGEYLPNSAVQEIFNETRNLKLEGKGDEREADFLKKNGFEEIGLDRTYETMVFKAQKMQKDGCGSCPYRIDVKKEADFMGYNDGKSAYKGHLKFCRKYEGEK